MGTPKRGRTEAGRSAAGPRGCARARAAELRRVCSPHVRRRACGFALSRPAGPRGAAPRALPSTGGSAPPRSAGTRRVRATAPAWVQAGPRPCALSSPIGCAPASAWSGGPVLWRPAGPWRVRATAPAGSGRVRAPAPGGVPAGPRCLASSRHGGPVSPRPRPEVSRRVRTRVSHRVTTGLCDCVRRVGAFVPRRVTRTVSPRPRRVATGPRPRAPSRHAPLPRICVSAAPARTITAPTGVVHRRDSPRIATPAAVAMTGMK